jgi:hypothetical protein
LVFGGIVEVEVTCFIVLVAVDDDGALLVVFRVVVIGFLTAVVEMMRNKIKIISSTHVL